MFKRQPPAFWYAPETSADQLWTQLLSPLGALYGFVSRKRFDLYYPVPMSRPVICVGNLVAGGAGKTPVVLSLVDMMQARGYNPHILTRGYGGEEPGPYQVAPNRDTSEYVGDEALLLVERAPTWVSRNRALGAQAAIDTGANLIIMDDGFQNAALYKDFSLIVVDGAVGFGNGRVMPAGPLRETLAFGISRADAAVIIGEDKTNAADEIRKHKDIPVFRANLVPDKDNLNLEGRTVFAFAGIGRPEKFKETIERAGAKLEGWGSYPDHMAYTEEDLADLVEAAESRGAMIVTTAKDYVRLPETIRPRVQKFSVHLEWENPEEVLQAVIRALPV